jgi:hypothetical protein
MASTNKVPEHNSSDASAPDRQAAVAKLSRKRRFLIKLSVIFLSVFVGLLIAEVALRIMGYTYPVFYAPDNARGYALRPGVEGWYRREGRSYVRINSDGLRDREHAKAKPSDTLRIALIGDSYAEAMQVPQENTFWTVMEQKLQECRAFGGRKVEVINFGVSGYSTAQELITLRQRVWDYSPDIVLLAVTTNNDVTDNLRVFKRNEEIPYFIYRDNRLLLDDSYLNSRDFLFRQSVWSRMGRWFRESLRVIQAIHEAHYAFKMYLASRRAESNTRRVEPVQTPSASNVQTPTAPTAQPTPQTENQSPSPARNVEIGIDNMVYQEPVGADWQEAWRVTEGLILLMRDEVKRKGAQLVVVTLSNGIQVHPKPAIRQSFIKTVGATDLFYPDLRLKTFCEREGIKALALAPPLQAYAEQNNVFLHGFDKDIGNGHWNVLGHRVAGEMLARYLCEGHVN